MNYFTQNASLHWDHYKEKTGLQQWISVLSILMEGMPIRPVWDLAVSTAMDDIEISGIWYPHNNGREELQK
jgi:hypothetical protein